MVPGFSTFFFIFAKISVHFEFEFANSISMVLFSILISLKSSISIWMENQDLESKILDILVVHNYGKDNATYSIHK